MEQILSVYFNIDRTYFTVLKSDPKGLELVYLNSTSAPVDLENMEETSTDVFNEIDSMLSEIEGDIDRVTVTLPSESVLVSQFPGASGMSEEEMKQLVSLEIKQSYPQFNFNDFTVNIIPLAERKDSAAMMMGVIMPKSSYMSCKKILQSLNQPLSNIEISQLSAHNAFLYNYPEKHESTVLLMGLQDQFIDVSVIKNKQPIYYNLVSLPDKDKFGEIFEAEFNKISEEVVEGISSAYFFGAGLTKDLHMMGWETSMLLGIEAMRLNAFRMMKTNLDPRAKEYCLRTLHIYPPCIGGAMPAYHENIRY